MADNRRGRARTTDGYTEWQIWRIRAKLIAYQLRAASDGKRYSLLNLAYDIEETLPRNHADDPEVRGQKPDRNFTIKQESLRRFLNGQYVEPEKLYILKNFLVEVEALTQADFDAADDTPEFLAVHQYLTIPDTDSSFTHREFAGRWVSTRTILHISESFAIDVQVDPSEAFFRAVESITKSEAETERNTVVNRKDKGVEKRYVRRGYGLVVGGWRGRIHIFLRPENRTEMVTYIETRLTELALETGGKIFLRNGGKEIISPVLEGRENLVYELGAYAFTRDCDSHNQAETG